jgi:hypothetical protein
MDATFATLSRFFGDDHPRVVELRQVLTGDESEFWRFFAQAWESKKCQRWPIAESQAYSPCDWIVRGAGQPTKTALRTLGTGYDVASCTYAQLDLWSRKLACKWHEEGLGAGHRVLVAHANPIKRILATMSLWNLGAIPVFPHTFTKPLLSAFLPSLALDFCFGVASTDVPELKWLDLRVFDREDSGLRAVQYRGEDPLLSFDDPQQRCPATCIDVSMQEFLRSLLRDSTFLWPMRANQSVLISCSSLFSVAEMWQVLCALRNGAQVLFFDPQCQALDELKAATKTIEWAMVTNEMASVLLRADPALCANWRQWSIPAIEPRSVELWKAVHQKVVAKNSIVATRDSDGRSLGVAWWNHAVNWERSELAWRPFWSISDAHSLAKTKDTLPTHANAAGQILLLDSLPSHEMRLRHRLDLHELCWQRTLACVEAWLSERLGKAAYLRQVFAANGTARIEAWIFRVDGKGVPEASQEQPDVARLVVAELGAMWRLHRIEWIDVGPHCDDQGALDRSWCESQIWQNLWPMKGRCAANQALLGLRGRLLAQRPAFRDS